jgi:hypothetical protein
MNGFGVVTWNMWKQESVYYNFFQTTIIGDYKIYLIVFLAIGLSITLIFSLIISKIVFKIEDLKNRVISLFVFIVQQDIISFRNDCIIFLKNNLTEFSETNKKNDVFLKEGAIISQQEAVNAEKQGEGI